MQISVIESNLKCGVCVHTCAAPHLLQKIIEDAYTRLLLLCKKNMILLDGLSHDNYKHKPIVCCCSLTIRFIDIIYVALLGMAVKPNSRCICIKSQFHKGSQILFSYSFPGMGDFYHHLIMSIMNNCSTSRSFREQQTILPLSFIILTNG
jgi:hypothetical protein